jgi:putative phosphoesterase
MRIAVVSDSHDNLEKIEKFVEVVNSEDMELVIHCGDFVSPFSVKLFLSKLKCDFIGVFGNNDGEVGGLLRVSGELIAKQPIYREIAGERFAIMHEPLFVDSLAKSGDFNYVLYGHTHEIDTRVLNGCQIVNPGELCGYLTGRSTFAILDTCRNLIEIRVI